MFKKFNKTLEVKRKKLEEKNFNSNFFKTLNIFNSHISSAVYTTLNLPYPYKKNRDGSELSSYEVLIVNLMKTTDKIQKICNEESTPFFANELFSETILMNEVNSSHSNHVPLEHEVIKDSLEEIIDGLKRALERYYQIKTASLKDELKISKTLRIREEEFRNEILAKINVEK